MINSYYERTDEGFEFDKEMETGKFKLVNSEKGIKLYDTDQDDEEIASFSTDYEGEREPEAVGQEVVDLFLDSEEVSEEFIEAAGGTDYLKIFISRLLESEEDQQ